MTKTVLGGLCEYPNCQRWPDDEVHGPIEVCFFHNKLGIAALHVGDDGKSNVLDHHRFMSPIAGVTYD